MSNCRQTLPHRTLGEEIRHLREQRGLGLNELAVLTGIDHGNLSKIEHDQKIPGPASVLKLAKSLHVPDGYFRHAVADALYARWETSNARD